MGLLKKYEVQAVTSWWHPGTKKAKGSQGSEIATKPRLRTNESITAENPIRAIKTSSSSFGYELQRVLYLIVIVIRSGAIFLEKVVLMWCSFCQVIVEKELGKFSALFLWPARGSWTSCATLVRGKTPTDVNSLHQTSLLPKLSVGSLLRTHVRRSRRSMRKSRAPIGLINKTRVSQRGASCRNRETVARGYTKYFLHQIYIYICIDI